MTCVASYCLDHIYVIISLTRIFVDKISLVTKTGSKGIETIVLKASEY